MVEQRAINRLISSREILRIFSLIILEEKEHTSGMPQMRIATEFPRGPPSPTIFLITSYNRGGVGSVDGCAGRDLALGLV